MINIMYLPKEETKIANKIILLLSDEFHNFHFQSMGNDLVYIICREHISSGLEKEMTTFARGAYFAFKDK
jgi:hypothetical protein